MYMYMYVRLADSLAWSLLDPEPGDRLGLCVQSGGPGKQSKWFDPALALALCACTILSHVP